MLTRYSIVRAALCVATLMLCNWARAQETEVTMPILDDRYVTLHENGTYAGPTTNNFFVGVEIYQGGWLRYRSATTWNPSPITDWAYLNSGLIYIRTIDGYEPGTSFSMNMRNMQNDPRTLSKQNLYADCGDGTTYASYSVSSGGTDEWEPLASSYVSYLDG